MNCPICNVPLVMSERNGIEIDYCQKCRGVWLDRGELDKIIEQSGSGNVIQSPSSSRPYVKKYDDDDEKYHKYGKKRKGFLGELFDF